MDEEDRLLSSIPRIRREEYFPGSISIQFLPFNGKRFLGEEPACSLLCGFCFCLLIGHAKSFALSFKRIFCELKTYFDPWEILTQEWVLFSVQRHNFWSQLHVHRANTWFATSNTGTKILVFSLDPAFRLWSLGRVYSRQATVLNCVRSPVSSVMKYCSFSTTFRNPASIQNLLKLVLLWQLLNSFLHIVAIEFFYAGSSLSKGTSVLIALSTREELDCPHHKQVVTFSRDRIHTLHISLRLLRKGLSWFAETIYAK